MDAGESERADESSKRKLKLKLMPKALALKIEALQEDRKAEVNQIKNLIL